MQHETSNPGAERGAVPLPPQTSTKKGALVYERPVHKVSPLLIAAIVLFTLAILIFLYRWLT